MPARPLAWQVQALDDGAHLLHHLAYGPIKSMSDVFTPLQLGAIELPNRILMAPLTRCRAEPGHVPGPLMAQHYAQRASAGLIIAEATMAMDGHSAFWSEPGIHSAAQVAGWKGVEADVPGFQL